MDVKEVRSTLLDPANAPAVERQPQKSPDPLGSLLGAESAEDSELVDIRSKTAVGNELRARINQAITVSNVASEATEQLARLVDSVGGIAEQAQDPGTSETRKGILEGEANQLIAEIQRTLKEATSGGVRPFAGEKIRVELEKRLGKTLELVIPDDASEQFGLGTINFSTKDTILNTIAHVQAAQESISRIRDAVGDSIKTLHEAASTLDVALQNSEASQTSIRDLDEALKVTGETKILINKHPDEALGSVGEIESNILSLLDTQA